MMVLIKWIWKLKRRSILNRMKWIFIVLCFHRLISFIIGEVQMFLYTEQLKNTLHDNQKSS